MSNEDHLQSMTNEWLHTVLKEIEKVPFSKQAKQSNVFEDTRIRLPCVGNCKSKINTLLLTDTNLQNFQSFGNRLPREVFMINGKGPKELYEKLSFACESDEKQFIHLVVEGHSATRTKFVLIAESPTI